MLEITYELLDINLRCEYCCKKIKPNRMSLIYA